MIRSLEKKQSFAKNFDPKWNVMVCFEFILREKCLYLELFWSIFLRIWTEYREILCIPPY